MRRQRGDFKRPFILTRPFPKVITFRVRRVVLMVPGPTLSLRLQVLCSAVSRQIKIQRKGDKYNRAASVEGHSFLT